MDQLQHMAAAIGSLPQGPIRRHFERALESARELQGGSAGGALPAAAAAAAAAAASTSATTSASTSATTTTTSSSSAAAPPASSPLLPAALSCLQAATAQPPLQPATLRSAAAALAIVVHCSLLSRGLVCTGAADTPPGEAFAAPHRPVPPAVLLPAGWDAGGEGGLWFRYRAGGGTHLYLRAGLQGGQLLLTLSSDRGGQAQAGLQLSRCTVQGQGGSALELVRQCCAPLGEGGASAEVEECVRSLLEGVGGSAGGSAGGSSLPLHAPPPSAILGMPQPLTGRVAGDFDSDLWLAPHAAQPGGLFGGGLGGGSLVGPGHPLFGTGQADLLPGLPPGARFDPMGPGVGRGRGALGPGPDHQRPPGWNN